MYLHAPTRSEPSMAPKGCESIYVLVPVANLTSKTIDWTKETQSYTERILKFLEEWGLKDLRKSIEVIRIFNPLDFKQEFHATVGNAFGIEPKISQIVLFRPHNRSQDIKNLYHVGADVHPGAGMPGVLLSAEATSKDIFADFQI